MKTRLQGRRDWLVELLRRLRLSTAVVTDTDRFKVLHPGDVMQTFRHLDLLLARYYQVVGSVPVDSRLAFKLSLKRSNGW